MIPSVLTLVHMGFVELLLMCMRVWAPEGKNNVSFAFSSLLPAWCLPCSHTEHTELMLNWRATFPHRVVTAVCSLQSKNADTLKRHQHNHLLQSAQFSQEKRVRLHNFSLYYIPWTFLSVICYILGSDLEVYFNGKLNDLFSDLWQTLVPFIIGKYLSYNKEDPA